VIFIREPPGILALEGNGLRRVVLQTELQNLVCELDIFGQRSLCEIIDQDFDRDSPPPAERNRDTLDPP
jgi:hypothetical protein